MAYQAIVVMRRGGPDEVLNSTGTDALGGRAKEYQLWAAGGRKARRSRAIRAEPVETSGADASF
jgi:hypothetical protein